MITRALKTGRGRLLSAAMLLLVCAAAYLAVAIGTGALAVYEGPLTGYTPVHWLATGALSYFIMDTLRLVREMALWTASGVKVARKHVRQLKQKWVAYKAARPLPEVAERQPVIPEDIELEVTEDDGEDDGVEIPVAETSIVRQPVLETSVDEVVQAKSVRAVSDEAEAVADDIVREVEAQDDAVEHETIESEAEQGDRLVNWARMRFVDWARGRITDGDETVSAEALIEMSGGDPSPKTFKRDLTKAANRLGREGIAIVPDQRLGYLHEGPQETVRLLLLPNPLPRIESASGDYAQSVLMAGLLAAVMHADDHAAEEEVEFLQSLVAENHGIDESEAARLEAWGEHLVEHPVAYARLARRLKTLETGAQPVLLELAVQMAQADHRVHPAEVEMLEKLCGSLGMPLADLYGALGAWRPVETAEDDEDAQSRIVAWAEDEDVGGFAIQGMRPDGASAGTTVKLNRERVASIEVDTAEVAVLLSDVFVDEADEASEPETPASIVLVTQQAGATEDQTEGFDGHEGLDAAHQALLDRLLEQQDLSRELFNEIARACDLMPDGAIETLNDWSFERFDDEIIEGDDTIVVNAALIGKMETGVVDGGSETNKAARA